MPAILFDLDGTIANSLPCIIDCSRLACQDLNIPWDEHQVNSLIGMPLLSTGEVLLGPGRGQEYYDAYHKHFMQYPEPKMTVYEGMPELLTKLKATDTPLAIVTSKVRKGCIRTLQTLDLLDKFSLLVTASDNCGFKPAPGPVLFACQKLGQKKEEVIFVGDSYFDISCGNAANISTCGVCWGAANKETLASYNPTFLAENLHELEQILFTWLKNFYK
ncbi:MAG: HAD family hydrolase [Bacillota bacterium]